MGLEEFDLSVRHLERAVELNPETELASLCLFFALWKNGRKDDAYRELERFVSFTGRYSEEYELMLRDLEGGLTDDEYDKIAALIDQKKLGKNGGNA